MRSRLLAGALTLLPLLATLYLLAWAYRLLGGWAEGFLGLWGLEVAESLRMALPLAALTAFLGTAYLVGFLAERHLGRKLIAWVERRSPKPTQIPTHRFGFGAVMLRI